MLKRHIEFIKNNLSESEFRVFNSVIEDTHRDLDIELETRERLINLNHVIIEVGPMLYTRLNPASYEIVMTILLREFGECYYHLGKGGLDIVSISDVGTVKWYREQGVKFILGDKRASSDGSLLTLNECGVNRANYTGEDDTKKVLGFAYRKIENVELEQTHPITVYQHNIIDDSYKVVLGRTNMSTLVGLVEKSKKDDPKLLSELYWTPYLETNYD